MIYNILYEKDDATSDTVSIEADNIEDYITEFNLEIGGWRERMIAFRTENKPTNE